MELRQLEYFVRVVELKSLTRAAEQLGIAQPALGVRIRKLEEELQVQLLYRHSRGVEPTEAGTRLLAHARELLERAEAAKVSVRQIVGVPRGRVTLGMPPAANFTFSAEVVRRCFEELPEVSLNIVEQISDSLLEGVRSGQLEMACGHAIVTDIPGLHCEPLLCEDHYFFGAPSVMPFNRPTIAFEELAKYPLILPGRHQSLRQRLEAEGARAGISLCVPFEVQSETLSEKLVAQGLGYTVLPYNVFRSALKAGTLRGARIVRPTLTANLSLFYRDRIPLSAAAFAIRNIIQQVVTDEIDHSGGTRFAPRLARVRV